MLVHWHGVTTVPTPGTALVMGVVRHLREHISINSIWVWRREAAAIVLSKAELYNVEGAVCEAGKQGMAF